MLLKKTVRAIAIFSTGVISTTYAQSIQFPGGAVPVITTPSVIAFDAIGRPARVADAATGGSFSASYDASGRLSSLKSSAGRNAFDLHMIGYGSDGRLTGIMFGNRYQLIFRYQTDGKQEIRDSLGNVIVRTPLGTGQYATQSVVDPNHLLVTALRLLNALFVKFNHVPGLAIGAVP